MARQQPTRFRYVDSDNPWIRLLYLPLLAIAFLLEVARPLPLLPAGWIGHAAGWPVLVGALLIALSGRAEPGEPVVRVGRRVLLRRRLYVAMPVAVVAIALIINSIWPLILLAAGTFLVIRLLATQGPGWTDEP